MDLAHNSFVLSQIVVIWLSCYCLCSEVGGWVCEGGHCFQLCNYSRTFTIAEPTITNAQYN